MSANKPTTPKDDTTAPPPSGYWREKEVLMGGAPDAEGEVETSQGESAATEEVRRRHVLSRRAGIAASAALAVFAVALAWIIVPVLVEQGSTSRSRPIPGGSPAKARKAERGKSNATRWVREPEAGTQPRRGHAAAGTPRSRHHARLRGEQRSAPAEPAAPSQPPESMPAPSAPAPSPASEPEKPRLRDGATESEEFGL